MDFFKKILSLVLISFVMPVMAINRPTIQFNDTTYYLARSYYELDGLNNPVNVIEFYLPQGDTSDNYSKYIKRVTLLQVENFKDTANAFLHEALQDNKQVPHEVKTLEDGKKILLNITFWWPFRTTVISKKIYVFQKDPQAGRAMYYLVGEDVFQESNKLTNADLVKQGKNLLLDKKVEDAARGLSF